ncbi:MarR family transcriptional regulator [Paenibacillus glucanolyticus]|uniref:MarR family transcriptional regulator n=1 Tax=Paenibacillus glucanolyticus TaxID=59843 RepID=UPI0034CEA5C4
MQNKELSKQWVYTLFLQLLTQHDRRDNQFAIRFDEELNSVEAELGMKLNLNLSEIHLIANIGSRDSLNVTALSEKTGLTKGSITRVSKKLLKLDLIRRQQFSDNKKEVYFTLTENGERLCRIHDRLHQEIEMRFKKFLEKYTPEQLAFAREFLQDLLNWDY